MSTALLTIDMQRYFLETGSLEKLNAVDRLVGRTNELISVCRQHGVPVMHVRIVHARDGSTWNQTMRPHWTGELLPQTLTEGTWEAEPHPALHVHEEDDVIVKTRGSAFLRTDLESRLRARGIENIILAGYSVDRCVGLTAIDAWERDFQVILAGDAIIGSTVDHAEQMLAYLKRAFQLEPLSNPEIIERLATV